MTVNYFENETFLEHHRVWKQEIANALAEGREKPPVPRKIAEMLMMVAKGMGKRHNWRGYCVDMETEALTQRGWVKGDQINVDDQVLSYDMSDGSLKWSPVVDIYFERYEGNMFHLKNRKIDALVTPGHKFVTQRGIAPVDDLKVSDQIILNSSIVEAPDDRVYSDAFVELLGWFVTEGSVEEFPRVRSEEKGYQVVFYQSLSANPSKCERIDKACAQIKQENQELNVSCIKRGGINAYRANLTLARKLVSCIDGSDLSAKIIKPEVILSLTSEQRSLLLSVMLLGDGTKNSNTTFQYVQKSSAHMDSFVMLAVLTGWSVRVTKLAFEAGFGFFDGWLATVKMSDHNRRAKVENIDMYGARRGAGGIPRPHTPTIPYSGNVWCVQTLYGSFVCRRNGRVYLTGNSYVDEMVLDAIENCIRYCANFKSEDPLFTNPFGYFSRVCEFSFYRRWHKEKGQADLKNKMVSELGPDAFASVNPEEESLIREWLDGVKLTDVNLNNQKPAKAKKKAPATKKPADNLFTRIEE